jgi:ADP-ribosylglycohydrolase
MEIIIGSLLGAICGWFLYNEKVHQKTIKHLNKSRKILKIKDKN